MNKQVIIISFFISLLLVKPPAFSQQKLQNIFEGHDDIGKVQHRSSVVYYHDSEGGTVITIDNPNINDLRS
jgi:hypothetical protein